MAPLKLVDGEAIELTPEEIAAREAEEAAWLAGQAERERIAANAPILAQLAALDTKRLRPLAAVLAATANAMTPDPVDLARLDQLNAEAAALRSQLV